MKKIINNIKILYFSLIVTPSVVHAQTVEEVVNNFLQNGHLGAVAAVIEIIVYLVGIVLGIKGALKLNEWSQTRGQQMKLSTPLMYFVGAGLMLGLPSIINIGVQSVFGQSANTSFSSGSGQYGGHY